MITTAQRRPTQSGNAQIMQMQCKSNATAYDGITNRAIDTAAAKDAQERTGLDKVLLLLAFPRRRDGWVSNYELAMSAALCYSSRLLELKQMGIAWEKRIDPDRKNKATMAYQYRLVRKG